MKKGQKGIFYLTGDSFETIRKSPSLERILKAGYEVVYMTDPLDEFVIGRMQDFDGTKLVSVAKENLELKDTSKAEKKHFEEVQEDFKPLCEFIQKKFDTKLDRVEVSKRLESSVAVLVSTQWGMSAFMEKIQRAQPMAQHQPAPASKRILEINYRHPIVKELKRRVDEDSEPEKSSELEDYVAIIYDSAVMSGGFQMEDVSGFSDRIEKIVRHGLSIPDDAEIEAEKEFEDDEPAEEDDEKDDVFDEEDDEGHTEL